MAENEKHSKEKKPKIYDAISLVIIGLGIGWLAGLSVSPVATILISGLLGIAIAIVGAVSIFLVYRDDEGKVIRSVGFKAAEKVSIGSLAWIVFGIALGVSIGIWVRTNNVLGVVSVEKQDNSFVKLQAELTQLKKQEGTGKQEGKWKGLDIPLSDIAQRILDKHYPKGGVVKKSAATDSAKNIASSNGTLSGSISDDDCKQLSSDSPSGKRDYIKMRSHKFPEFVPLLDKSDKELEQAIHSKCSSSSE